MEYILVVPLPLRAVIADSIYLSLTRINGNLHKNRKSRATTKKSCTFFAIGKDVYFRTSERMILD